MQLQRPPALMISISLTIILLSSTFLTGCGSLTRILSEPEPPRVEASIPELTRVVRTEDSYENIEVLHGTWDEPQFSPDERGYFYEEEGWIYLHIEGEPAERGYQHGWLLADYIQQSIQHNKTKLAHLNAIDWEFFKLHAKRMWEDDISEELRAELEGIVEGAAERGATFDYTDLLVLNGLEELRDCWFPTVQDSYYQELALGLWNPEIPAGEETDAGAEETIADESSESATQEEVAEAPEPSGNNTSGTEESQTAETSEPAVSATQDTESPSTAQETGEIGAGGSSEGSLGESAGAGELGGNNTATWLPGTYEKQASALIATGSFTEDGSIILAHNTIASYTDANFANIMIDVDPAKGQRFTMQAEPGFIHSFGEAYSTDSLLVANTRIKGFTAYREDGIPEFLRIRESVQYAETLDAFTQAMLNGNNGGLASSWLVGELETGEIMELELGLSFYNVQKLMDGCFISFNGVDDSRIMNFETDGTALLDIRLGTGSRSVRLAELCEQNNGKLTTETAKSIISDHKDVYLNKTIAGSRGICAHYETDSAEYTTDSDILPNMPYGTVDAKVMSTELAREHTIVARWGSACGKAFDSQSFIEKNPQYSVLEEYLYDRASHSWNEFYPYGE